MAEKTIVCPECNNDAHVYKVSQLYMESIMRMKEEAKAVTPTIDKLKAEASLDQLKGENGKNYYRDVVQTFKPPQGASQGLRSIDPDWIAVAAGLVCIFFLNKIYINNPDAFWYMVILVAVGYGLYFLFHKRIKAKYQKDKSNEFSSKDKVEKAVGMWMKLYYCSTDNVIFGLKKDQTIPLDQMNASLIEAVNKTK
jgi:hypothetical protein